MHSKFCGKVLREKTTRKKIWG